MLVILSSNAFAASNYYRYGNGFVVTTPNGSQVYMPNKTAPAVAPMTGQGVTFYSDLIVTKEIVKQEKEKDKTVVHYSAWVRNCNTVILPSKSQYDQTAHNGQKIELKFERAGSCNVADWKIN